MPSKSISDNGKLHNFIHRNCAGQTGMNSQYSMFFKNRRTYVPFICFSVCGCTTMASQIFVALQQKSWVAKTILHGNLTVEKRSEKIKEEKECKKKKRKSRKVAIQFVFPVICGSGGSKRRFAKAAGAEPCGQMRDEKLH